MEKKPKPFMNAHKKNASAGREERIGLKAPEIPVRLK